MGFDLRLNGGSTEAVCTTRYAMVDSGVQVTGQLAGIVDGSDGTAWIRLDGPAALSFSNQILPGQGPEDHADGFSTAIGPSGVSTGDPQLPIWINSNG